MSTPMERSKSGGVQDPVDDFSRLQEMDAKLNEDTISKDVERLLAAKARRGSTTPKSSAFTERVLQAKYNSSNAVGSNSTQSTKGEDDLNSMADIYGKEGPDSPVQSQNASVASNGRLTPNPLTSPVRPVSPGMRLGTETSDRYSKAKVTMLSNQLKEAGELKVKLEEQVKDLQKQLNTTREENRNANKRIQQLELEIRRGSKRGGESTANSDPNASEELAKVKKDLETAERIAKQADTNSKSKDAQLKRATETISRLKSQLTEAQQQMATGTAGDQSKIEALEQRNKLLEKQRNELLEGFRKQMKLIDVLKRQKLHLEAARLLAFTEEEFMKSLDWNV